MNNGVMNKKPRSFGVSVKEFSPRRIRSSEIESSEPFVISLENTYAVTIWATNWHGASVIPAKAGIHPLTPLDAGLRRHDELREEPSGAEGAAISYFVDECRLMDTSW
jgi:hypothetical protein